jgi:hypothetical protein
LSRWLKLLEVQDTYVPYRPDKAKKIMLRKLLRGTERAAGGTRNLHSLYIRQVVLGYGE